MSQNLVCVKIAVGNAKTLQLAYVYKHFWDFKILVAILFFLKFQEIMELSKLLMHYDMAAIWGTTLIHYDL
jgi:hypothetical protein